VSSKVKGKPQKGFYLRDPILDDIEHHITPGETISKILFGRWDNGF
jgi:hypothetical protein